MLSCTDAMVLTDKSGKIVHCNRSWVKLTGHTLNDAEGLHWNILHGSMTDSSEIRRCSTLHKASLPSVSTVINYRKDGLMFTNSVTISPIRGVYMSEGTQALHAPYLLIYICNRGVAAMYLFHILYGSSSPVSSS